MHTIYPTRHLDAVEILLDEFSYWPSIPELSKFSDVTELRRAYERQSGPTHWFDAATLKFFGSRNRHMTQRGLLLETQTNSPDGVGRYSLTAWVYDDTATADHRGGPRLEPKKLGNFATLAEARQVAHDVTVMWDSARKAHRLRAAGAPGDVLDLLDVIEALA